MDYFARDIPPKKERERDKKFVVIRSNLLWKEYDDLRLILCIISIINYLFPKKKKLKVQ